MLLLSLLILFILLLYYIILLNQKLNALKKYFINILNY